MSRTTFKVARTGEVYPQKTDKRKITKSTGRKKFFGYRKGDGTVNNAKKNEDYINYGYPLDLRNKKELIDQNANKLTKEEIDDSDIFMINL